MCVLSIMMLNSVTTETGTADCFEVTRGLCAHMVFFLFLVPLMAMRARFSAPHTREGRGAGHACLSCLLLCCTSSSNDSSG